MCGAHNKFISEAIRLSIENVDAGGGPFGAVIVKNGNKIASGVNKVAVDIDPTAHAEIIAIRNAAQTLGSFDLSGCIIYSSCEPCPMCLSAIYWAKIDKIYYGNSKKDAALIDFADDFIYKELELKPENRKIPSFRISQDDAFRAFEKWKDKEDKISY